MPHHGNVKPARGSLAMPAWARKAYENRRPDARRGTAALAAPTGGSFVNIVAHSDDDLLFLNPDILPAIKAGLPMRTIVITADENNGVEGLMTREELAAQLWEGTRRAYASLAQVASNWHKETMVVAGRTVELNTLIPAPHVQLIWLALPDGGDDLHVEALTKLWQDPNYVTDTIVPTGGPVTFVQQYNGQQLYQVLVELLVKYQPTTIRVQDPYPDERSLFSGDHTDHVAAASFGQLAVRAYEGPNASQFALLLRYRCYNTAESSPNVPDALLKPKSDAYGEYNALDPLSGPAFDINLARNYHRFPVTVPFALRDGTGAIHVVVNGADDVIHWRLNNGATTWTGPTSLVAGSFAPGVAMARNANGRIQLAVLDLNDGNIKVAKQTAAGGNFGAWTSLGSPDTGAKAWGTPALGMNSGNCLEMYVLDANGSLSNAYQSAPNGAFAGWEAISGGPNVLGQSAAITAPNGELHVFADNNGQVQHWVQPPNSGTALDSGFPAIESTATPAPALENSGVARLLTREYMDGAVGSSVQNSVGGTWSDLIHHGGKGGIGPVSVVLSGGGSPRLIAFVRNDNYGISVSRQAADGSFGAWQDLGGYCEIGPTAITDGAGFVHLLAVGGDCRLYERRQTVVGPGGAFGDWTVAGSGV